MVITVYCGTVLHVFIIVLALVLISDPLPVRFSVLSTGVKFGVLGSLHCAFRPLVDTLLGRLRDLFLSSETERARAAPIVSTCFVPRLGTCEFTCGLF